MRVRRARVRRITALNDTAYDLSPSNLVIADEGGPIAIAGVIGGEDSAISETTTSIVLESANFQASSVRKTSSALKLRTDASMRFEKAQDPVNTIRALARAIELLQELSPGIRLVGGLADAVRPRGPIPPVTLDLDWLARKLGRTLEAARVRAILESLEFGVEPTGPRAILRHHSVLARDQRRRHGGRLGGRSRPHDRLRLHSAAASPDCVHRAARRSAAHVLRQVKNAVALQGFTEVSNYSFVSEEQVRRFGMRPEDHVRVLNPIAADQSLMRHRCSRASSRILKRTANTLALSGCLKSATRFTKETENFPAQVPHLRSVVFSREGDGTAGLFELKRLAEILAPGAEVQAVEARPYEHPARTAEILWQGEAIGRLFELHPALGAKRAPYSI